MKVLYNEYSVADEVANSIMDSLIEEDEADMNELNYLDDGLVKRLFYYEYEEGLVPFIMYDYMTHTLYLLLEFANNIADMFKNKPTAEEYSLYHVLYEAMINNL